MPQVNRISLLSSSYSGSTIFGILLGQDPRFCAFGDMYTIDGISSLDDMCNCGETIAGCKLRVDLMTMLKVSGYPPEIIHDSSFAIPFECISSRYGGLRIFTVYRILGRIFGYENVYRQFIEREQFLLNALGESGGYEYFVDGTKSTIRADIFMNIDSGSKLVHLIRDPLSVVSSGVERHDNKGRSMRSHLKSWVTYNKIAKNMCEKYPDRSIRISFDSLVKETPKVLSEISKCLFLSELNVDPQNVKGDKTHVIGNRARHSIRSVNPNQLVIDAKKIEECGVPRIEIDEAMRVYDELSVDLL